MEPVDQLTHLRPLEHRVTRLAAEGVVLEEIGRRFRRSGESIEQVLTLASLPGRRAPTHRGLRPIERRLLRWVDAGSSMEELADRFRRGPGYLERVLTWAAYRQRALDGP